MSVSLFCSIFMPIFVPYKTKWTGITLDVRRKQMALRVFIERCTSHARALFDSSQPAKALSNVHHALNEHAHNWIWTANSCREPWKYIVSMCIGALCWHTQIDQHRVLILGCIRTNIICLTISGYVPNLVPSSWGQHNAVTRTNSWCEYILSFLREANETECVECVYSFWPQHSIYDRVTNKHMI